MSSAKLCPSCKSPMVRWGTYKTAQGTRKRWRCTTCKMTTRARVDTNAKDLAALIDYVCAKQVLADYPGKGRTLQRRMAKAWEYWPLTPVCDEACHVIHVDGIHLAPKCVLLIAMSTTHVVGWHLARSENTAAWQALISRIAAPDVVVCDGGAGFAKARRYQWPNTAVQRCTFHIANNVQTLTTRHPLSQAGTQLYVLADRLHRIHTQTDQAKWIGDFTTWCARWKNLLAEKTTLPTGRVVNTHDRLVRARNLLNARLRAADLFTYLDPDLTRFEPIPATNNRIESFNGRIRDILRTHRGWRIDHRIKAAMWLYYTRTPFPQPPAVLAATMPTNTQIQALYKTASQRAAERAQRQRLQWGQAIAWHELTWSRQHHKAINE